MKHSLWKDTCLFGMEVLHLFLYRAAVKVPLNNKIWIFGAWFGESYNDNSKYFFQYVSKNYPDIKAIWLSRNKKIIKLLRQKGLRAYYFYDPIGIWYALRAGVAVFCVGYTADLPGFCLSGKKKLIQLWHGSPLKKVGVKNTKPKDTNQRIYPYIQNIFFNKVLLRIYRKLFHTSVVHISHFMYKLELYQKYTYITALSPITKKTMIESFNISNDQSEKIIVTGFPRDDIFFNDKTTHDLAVGVSSLDRTSSDSGKPTTSQSGFYRDKIYQAIQSEEKMSHSEGSYGVSLRVTSSVNSSGLRIENLINRIHKSGGSIGFYLPTHRQEGEVSMLNTIKENLKPYQQILENENIHILIKLHQFHQGESQGENLRNVIFVTENDLDGDVYPLLPLTDFLITDYSSIYFDYLLLDKPIIFLNYDLKEYINLERDFYYSYQQITAGPKVSSWKQLIPVISQQLRKDNFKNKRQKIKKLIYTYCDGNSSKRIAEKIYNEFVKTKNIYESN